MIVSPRQCRWPRLRAALAQYKHLTRTISKLMQSGIFHRATMKETSLKSNSTKFSGSLRRTNRCWMMWFCANSKCINTVSSSTLHEALGKIKSYWTPASSQTWKLPWDLPGVRHTKLFFVARVRLCKQFWKAILLIPVARAFWRQ